MAVSSRWWAERPKLTRSSNLREGKGDEQSGDARDVVKSNSMDDWDTVRRKRQCVLLGVWYDGD